MLDNASRSTDSDIFLKNQNVCRLFICIYTIHSWFKASVIVWGLGMFLSLFERNYNVKMYIDKFVIEVRILS